MIQVTTRAFLQQGLDMLTIHLVVMVLENYLIVQIIQIVKIIEKIASLVLVHTILIKEITNIPISNMEKSNILKVFNKVFLSLLNCSKNLWILKRIIKTIMVIGKYMMKHLKHHLLKI